jgi:hypothetical protein
MYILYRLPFCKLISLLTHLHELNPNRKVTLTLTLTLTLYRSEASRIMKIMVEFSLPSCMVFTYN